MSWLEKERDPGSPDTPAFKYVKLGLGIFAVLALAFIAYFYTGHTSGRHDAAVTSPSATPLNLEPIVAADKISTKPAKKLWVCPMHPEIIQDHPGMCPICGMDLVEMEPSNKSHAGHSHGVQLDTASLQRLGVRLAAAKWETLSRDIDTYGNVVVDESMVSTINSNVSGVIKKLHVKSVGQQVQEGQVLYELYSPELIQSQREFIALLREMDKLVASMMGEDSHTSGKGMSEDDMMDVKMNANNRRLVTESLLYANVGKELLEELGRTYREREVVEVRSPKSGFVTKIEAHDGNSIKPMDSLFSLVGLSQVWVEVALYPDQLSWVKDGDEVTLRLSQLDKSEIKARLQFVNPVVDSVTRTVRARLAVANPKNRLLPGALVDVTIHAKPHLALAVPRSAVMRTGKGDLVMLAEGEGHFAPVKVETGVETSEFIEITSGLEEDDQVAVNGQFLLDAAASLSDAAQRMRANHSGDKH
ncbi:Cation efflux system protein CusB [Anaerolineales bacterium]|nr:Cation efflux system protein CusB [Anaerolineales bacterium]